MYNDNIVIFYNGKYRYYKNVNIGLMSNSLNFGTAVIDSVRLNRNKNCYYGIGLECYFDRFVSSLNNYIYNIDIKYNDFKGIIIKLLKLNKNLEYPYFRLIMFQGDNDLNIRSKSKPNFAIIPLSLKIPKYKLNLVFSEKKRESSSIHKYKLANQYGKNIYDSNLSSNNINDTIVFLDSNNNILECLSENIFFVDGEIIYTPKEDNILSGVNRKIVIQYLKLKGFIVKELDINLNNLDKFSEIFLTGSATGVRKVYSINSKVIFGKKNRIYNIINNFYDKDYLNFKTMGSIIIEKLI